MAFFEYFVIYIVGDGGVRCGLGIEVVLGSWVGWREC
jgi:hypothetical protein